MKSRKFVVFPILLTLSLLLSSGAAAASPAPSLAELAYETETQGVSVSLQKVGGEYYLFLPSSADLTALTLTFEGEPATVEVEGQALTVTSGEPFDLASLYPDTPADGVYTFTLSRDSEDLTVKVMVSANIASMFITSDDPASKGRSYVEAIKGNKATGQMTLLSVDGSVIYSDALTQIKGRGNSTWGKPKRPYQIKLAVKTDLMETGDSKEASKTWVLLANYSDASLIRNTLSHHLAADFAMPYSPNCRPVDLYYDGVYRGSYLLSEKTEVGKGRVNVHDLEGDFEDANPQVEDFDDLAIGDGVNSYGNAYQYVTGLNDPEDISGGYLLEIDIPERAALEKSYFSTSHGYILVSKSPEYLSQTAIEYISEFYQEFEDAVFNGGINPNTGKSYADYVDLDSLARFYLFQELTQNGDAFRTSSFFYKPADEDKLYAGPVWDFDLAYGNFNHSYSVTDMAAAHMPIGQALLSMPSFCKVVEEIYQAELHPLITNIVLSDDPLAQGDRLHSLAGYSAEVAASWQMDAVLWPGEIQDLDEAIARLKEFLIARDQHLHSVQWSEVVDTLPLFFDVPLDEWFAPAVAYLTDKGIFKGTTGAFFSPNNSMTRLSTAIILYRLAGSPEVKTECVFADVTHGPYYEDVVAWATENGIVQGYPDGTFRPDAPINRQTLVTLLYRYAQFMGMDVTAPPLPEVYIDRDSVADWAVDAFAWGVDRGLITGTTATRLSPTRKARRSMAAVLIQRFDELISTQAAGGEPTPEPADGTDNQD